jgi:FkbM family methyltransferase
MGRKIYIDLGANHGYTTADFMRANPNYIAFAFEPTPHLAEKLRRNFAGPSNVLVMEYAAWIWDGVVELFCGIESDQSTTVLTGKRSTPDWNVDYTRPHLVRSIDFDRWLRENTSDDDEIVLKMDIEGAEYKVLSRCIDTGSIARVKVARVEWHWNRYPQFSQAEHERIRDRLREVVQVEDWS